MKLYIACAYNDCLKIEVGQKINNFMFILAKDVNKQTKSFNQHKKTFGLKKAFLKNYRGI